MTIKKKRVLNCNILFLCNWWLPLVAEDLLEFSTYHGETSLNQLADRENGVVNSEMCAREQGLRGCGAKEEKDVTIKKKRVLNCNILFLCNWWLPLEAEDLLEFSTYHGETSLNQLADRENGVVNSEMCAREQGLWGCGAKEEKDVTIKKKSVLNCNILFLYKRWILLVTVDCGEFKRNIATQFA